MKRADIKADGVTQYLIEGLAHYADKIAVVERIEEFRRRPQARTSYRVRIHYVAAGYSTTVPLSQVLREWTAEDVARAEAYRLKSAEINRASSAARDRLNAALAAAGIERMVATVTKGGALSLSNIRVEDADKIVAVLERATAEEHARG